MVAVFIDRTGSTDADRDVYNQALKRIRDSLEPGDRIVIGPITAQSGRDFSANIDREFPKPFPPKTFSDNDLIYKKKLENYNKNLNAFRESLEHESRRLVEAPSNAAKTTIFETLVIAGQIFASEKRGKALVVLSDMLEDSSISNFEKIRLDERASTSLLARITKEGLLPDLSGVTVYVAGAESGTQRAAAVEKFWLAYFAACGASIPRGHYSRTLLTFERGPR